MDVEKYIASGILELYVAGVLTEEQNLEVFRYAREYPRIKEEILAIEASILALSKTAAGISDTSRGIEDLKYRIGKEKESKVVAMPSKKANWRYYSGWAAALVLALGLLWTYIQNQDLKSEIEIAVKARDVLEEQIFEARNSLAASEELLKDLRHRNITVISLGGQAVSPDSYAKAYWNKEEKKVFIDAQGLPEPPDGMVYQVWSLKLSPLTPTSMGLLDDFTTDENKIFVLANPNDSEAFGITLEPAGGSATPTMEQLYTLGAVSSS